MRRATGQNPARADAGARGHGGIESAHGHAREIDYDMEHELLKLDGDAWLSDGCNEISSQSIVYDIVNQKVRAGRRTGRRHAGARHAARALRSAQCAPAGGRP